MTCAMFRHEFCWVHLTKWVVGEECQRGHWSSDPVINSTYNTQQQAAAAAMGLRDILRRFLKLSAEVRDDSAIAVFRGCGEILGARSG